MADEPKISPPAGPVDASGQTPGKGADAAPTAPAVPPKTSPAAKPPAAAGTAAPARPPAPKPVVKPEPWSSPQLEQIHKKFPGAITEALIFRGQPAITLQKDAIVPVAEFLKSNEGGAYVFLTDQTAVDYPKREKRFEVVYHLYSFVRNDRLRLKLAAGEDDKVPSVTNVWPAANWMEREIFDMFGIVFEGHRDLKRILLPLDWTGYPLRKDYDSLRQDEAWVQANLHIKSGQ